MQPGTPRFSEGETTSRPNIDTFGRYLIIFGRFFRGLSLRADSDPGGANFYIFVPSLGLPKITARDGSSSSTAEKKVVRRHGVRSLIVYSTLQDLKTLPLRLITVPLRKYLPWLCPFWLSQPQTPSGLCVLTIA